MDGAPPPDEDFTKLSVEDRLGHKNWKARVSAYEELIKTFRSTVAGDDPAFRPYSSNPDLLKRAVLDANAVAQEKGIECACSFVEWAGPAAARPTREAVIPAAVDKALGSARAGTKAKAVELCLLYVEVEENADGILPSVIEGLGSKQPKAVLGAVTVLKELVKQFGVKVVNPKPVLKTLAPIFAHSDKNVRAEGTLLAQELYRYLGPALDPHLADLKPVQVKELNESFAALEAAGDGKGKGMQTRFTRSQQRQREVKATEGALEGVADAVDEDEAPAEAEEVDAFDFAEPVAILAKLPPDFYEKLASTKWKERKEEALDLLLAVARVPRIRETDDYGDLVRALAGRIPDVNIACATAAAQCIEALARGLRTAFARHKSTVMPPLLERLKEKKQSVVDAMAAALDATSESVSLNDIVEDVATFAKHKNPQVKAETLKFLVRALRSTRSPPSREDTKTFASLLLTGCEDGFEPVRTAAAEGLGTLMKVVGERVLAAQLEGLDDLRKARVREFFEKAEVKCKPTAAGAPAAAKKPVAAVAKAAPAGAPKPRVLASVTNIDKEAASPTGSRAGTPVKAARPPVKAAPRAATAAAPPAKKPVAAAPTASTSRVAPKAAAVEPLKYRLTQEDADAQAPGVLPSGALEGLASANWKERLAAFEETLLPWIEAGDADAVEAELIVRTLAKKPGWKESNFQVFNKMIAVFSALAERSPSWSKACVALVTPTLSDKLGDIKVKKAAADALILFAEKSSLQFVLSQAYDAMTKQKAPKAQADALAWVEQALRDFGIAGLAVRELIDFLKTGLKSSNAAVRTSATKSLVTLRLFIGPGVKDFLQDLNPALLTTIDTEFDKVASETAPEPTRFSTDFAAPAPAAVGGKGKAAAAGAVADPLEDLFPRVDLDKLVPSAVVSAVGDTNWKARKEALETIQSLLEANKRLKPNFGELATPLKLRLADSNIVVRNLALDIIRRIASGMNKPFEKHARPFVTPMAAILGDAKATVRAGALTCLTAMADAAGLDPLLPNLAASLELPKPDLRRELLLWLDGRFADPATLASLDLTPLAAPLLACLEDRNPEVRKAAQAVLPNVVAGAGYSFLMDQTSGLKPASRSTVIPFIEAARSAAAASAPAPAPAAKAPPRGLAGPAAKVAKAASTATSSSTSRAATPTLPAEDLLPKPRPPALSSLKRSNGPGATSRSVSASAPPPPPVPSSSSDFPLRTTDSKAKQIRAAKDAGPGKWILEGVARPDQVEQLYQQMGPHVSGELLGLLFSKDHHAERDYLHGLALLDDLVANPSSADLPADEVRQRVIANLDLVLKYMSIRLADHNSSLISKCLDLIEHLVTLLSDSAFRLSDYEASCFLPTLISKVGDQRELMRTRIRAIFRTLCSLYPFSKVFSALLEHGVTSKNGRARSESVEELGMLFQRQGISVCQPTKALPAIAALIADRDATVRSAALNALAIVYTAVGDDIYAIVGRLPEKDRAMLDEKLKRTTSNVASPPRVSSPPRQIETKANGSFRPMAGPRPSVGRPMVAEAPPEPVVRAAMPEPVARPAQVASLRSVPVAGPAIGSPSAPSSRRQSTASVSALPYLSPSRSSLPPPAAKSSRAPAQYDVEGMCAAILSEDANDAVDALKQLQKDITSRRDALLEHVDPLVDAISHQMRLAFDEIGPHSALPVMRLCKHLMHALSTFFDERVLGAAVTRPSLIQLLAELTRRLLETADDASSEAISSLSKVLNMVLIRIFHNSDRSACFGALFSVLQTVTADLRDLQGPELAERAKYAELVMKCLWKVSKTAKESLEDRSLEPRQLLLDIDDFLTGIPPAEWRRRSADNIPLGDMPLRTVKTVLQQVVSVFGERVYDELGLIDMPENSFVYAYLHRLLNSPKGANGEMPRPGSAASKMSRASSEVLAPVPARANGHAKSSTSPTTESMPASPRAPSSPRLPSSPQPSTSSSETDRELAAICKRVSDPQSSKQGIRDLYEFRNQHPELESRIALYIKGTGQHFQAYIQRTMQNLAAEDAEREAMNAPAPEARAPLKPMLGGLDAPPRSPRLGGPGSRSRIPSGNPAAGDDKLATLQSLFRYKARDG